jgi:IclR family acetate operon transcriptional repressor
LRAAAGCANVPPLEIEFRMSEHMSEHQLDEPHSSLDKAIDLLFHLHAAGEPQGVTAVSRALGTPKSSAHRLLATLARRGLLERDGSARYRPGVGLVALGLGVLEREPVVAAARPELESAAAELGETVFLTAARGGAPVVLDLAEGTGFLRAAPRRGDRVPVHATAVGRLFLALAPDAVALEAEPFTAFTPATPRTRAALAERVARARERGWDENRGEWIAGLWVVAAPVWAHGRLVAALATAAPEGRLEAPGGERVAGRLLAAARRTAERLEGRSDDGGARERRRSLG